MAVLWKEAARPERVADDAAETEPLEAPFDVITYAGPITMAGYERLSELLETRKTRARALLVLETPGGDPHAAFRIARAIGCHYEEFHALVPRYCKSAGTLIVVGAAVLHMDDRAELGPLDMQVPRPDVINGRSSALEFCGVLDSLRPHQLGAFVESLQDLADEGLTAEGAFSAVAKLVGGLYRPIAEQIDPHRLVEMERAMAIAMAYGVRLAATGENIDHLGLRRLATGYPSHAFVIDRREARSSFQDVRAPEGDVSAVARSLPFWMKDAMSLGVPVVDLQPYPITNHEVCYAKDCSEVRPHSGGQADCLRERAETLSRSLRPGSKADLGMAGNGRATSEAAPLSESQSTPPDVH